MQEYSWNQRHSFNAANFDVRQLLGVSGMTLGESNSCNVQFRLRCSGWFYPDYEKFQSFKNLVPDNSYLFSDY